VLWPGRRGLAQYRAALAAGADPASVAKWITETEAEKARLRAIGRPATPRPAMTREEIESTVTALAGLLAVIRDADPPDKAEIYTRLGLKLTYQPAGQIVRTEVNMMSAAQHWSFDSVRGGI
jgi:site-specific DNA recombinase